MIDLLDRLITDAKVRAERVSQRNTKPVRPLASPGLARESQDVGSDAVPPSRAGGSALPRALVLVTTETFCTNCGARSRSPSYAILAEYAFNEVSLCRTMDDVRRHDKRATQGAVAREHRTRTVHAPACEACF